MNYKGYRIDNKESRVKLYLKGRIIKCFSSDDTGTSAEYSGLEKAKRYINDHPVNKFEYYRVIQEQVDGEWHDSDYYEADSDYHPYDWKQYKENMKAYRENAGVPVRSIGRKELIKQND